MNYYKMLNYTTITDEAKLKQADINLK